MDDKTSAQEAEDRPPIHSGSTPGEVVYLLSADDARWLAAIGISPTRHRSPARRALPRLRPMLPPPRDDG